nr:NADH dehydrogenase subunit 3 [Armandia sp. GK-2021]
MNMVSMIIVMASLVILGALSGAGVMIYSRLIFSREKSSAYECGLDPNMSARVPFSLRFFLLAVILLVFDVEIALLMAVPAGLSVSFKSTVICSTFFLLILFFGLLHEWREGSLNWL